MDNENPSYYDFADLVDLDVRDNTNDNESEWLRKPENIARFWKELRRLELTVTEQLEMAQSAVDALPEGSERRRREQAVTDKNKTKRKFYRSRVRERLAEVEDIAGGDTLATSGQVKLVLDAALDALDRHQTDRAVKYLEGLLDAIDPLPADGE